MNLHWLLRMRKWVQHPPSKQRVMLVLAVVAICAVLFVVERYLGWPAWLTAEPSGPTRMPR